MKCYTIVLNPLQTNCYLLEKNNHVIIFDPSMDIGNDMSSLLAKIKDDWTIDAIVLTHGHYDHISAVDALYELYQPEIFIHQNDLEYLSNPILNASAFMNEHFVLESPVTTIKEGPLKIGEFEFEVVLTPGHTPGSISLFIDDFAIVGDCIFKNSIGRTDLPGGSSEDMKKSLDYFKSLSKDYQLLPGHGDRTKLSVEKIMNPFLNGSN